MVQQMAHTGTPWPSIMMTSIPLLHSNININCTEPAASLYMHEVRSGSILTPRYISPTLYLTPRIITQRVDAALYICHQKIKAMYSLIN